MAARVDPRPPAEHPGYLAFEQFIAEGGLNPDAARRLLWFSGAHPSLTGQAQVFRQMLRALESEVFAPENLQWASAWRDELGEYRRALQWLEQRRAELAALPDLSGYDAPFTGGSRRRRAHPLLGLGINAVPIASALWNEHQWQGSADPARRAVAQAFARLQAHVLAVYMETRLRSGSSPEGWERHAPLCEFAPIPVAAASTGLALRKLSLAGNSSLVQALPDLPDTLTLAQTLQGFDPETVPLGPLDDEAAHAARSALHSLRSFLGQLPAALGQDFLARRHHRGPRESKGGAPHVHGWVPFTAAGDLVVLPSAAGDDDPGRAIVVVAHPPQAGVPPDEAEPQVELIDPGASAGALSRARFARMAIEMSAQRFHWDNDQLTVGERRALVQAIEQALQAWDQHGSSPPAAVAWRATGALTALLCLLLGQSADEVERIQVHRLEDPGAIPPWPASDPLADLVQQTLDRTVLVLTPPTCQGGVPPGAYFVVPALVPEYAGELPTEVLERGRPTARRLLLPVEAKSPGRWLLRWTKDHAVAGLRSLGLPGDGCARQALEDFLRGIEPHGSQASLRRLTPARLASALPTMLFHLTQESCVGWLVCRQTMRQREARLHYTQLGIGALVSAYGRALHHLGLIASTTARRWQGDGAPPPGIAPLGIGARFVVREGELRALVARLRSTLAKAPTAHDADALTRYHHAYVLYVIVLQALHTALRSVNAPVALVAAHDQVAALHDGLDRNAAASRLAGMADKETKWSQRARLVEMSQPLSEQLSDLERHNTAVVQRLGIFDAWAGADPGTRALFVLGAELRPEPVTTLWIESTLHAHGCPMPANFARGFLRTELLARGCPAPSVDALMGHHNAGESPFAPYSSFNYGQHLRTLARHLAQIHRAIGLAVVQSRLLPQGHGRIPGAWQAPLKALATHDPKRRGDGYTLAAALRAPERARPRHSTIALSGLWREVDRDATRDDRREIPQLLRFLLSFTRNEFARYLLSAPAKADGRAFAALEGTLAVDAREIEGAIVERVIVGTLEHFDASCWLRLILRASNLLACRGLPMPGTHLLSAVRAPSSPFTPEEVHGVALLEHWRDAFWRWIQASAAAAPEPAPEPAPKPDPEERLAAVIISAVMHGAAMDGAKLNLILDLFAPGGARTLQCVKGRCYVDFVLPMGTATDRQYHRWWLDPLTELLWLQVPELLTRPQLGELRRVMLKMLASAGVASHLLPQGWRDLRARAMLWWQCRGTTVDAMGAARHYPSHSIRPQSWARITRPSVWTGPGPQASQGAAPPEAGPAEHAASDAAGARELATQAGADLQAELAGADLAEENQRSLMPWLDALLARLGDAAGEQPVQQLRDPGASRTAAGTFAGTFASWAAHMGAPGGEGLSARHVRRRLALVAPAVVGEIGLKDPSTIDSDEWAAAMARIVAQTQASANDAREMLAGLDSLASLLGHADDPEVRAALAGDGQDDLVRVDAQVMSIDEFEHVMEHLRSCSAPAMTPQERSACRITFMLSFRLGLRPKELYGLRLCDYQPEGRSDFLTRPYPGHTMKTVNGERRLPLRVLLAAPERKALREWVTLLRRRPGVTDDSPLIANYATGTPVDRPRIDALLNAAIRQALDAPKMRLYHCRHSFATWTALALRACDAAEVQRLLSDSPRTVQWLRRGRRVRRWLLGGSDGPDRRACYALARLLGHIGPGISYRHYVHGDDLMRAAATLHGIGDVPRSVWLAASGMSRSATYAALAQGDVLSLTARARTHHGWTETPTTDKDGNDATEEGDLKWLSAQSVRAALRATQLEGRSARQAAAQLGIPEARLDQVIEHAKEGLAATAPPGAAGRAAAADGALARPKLGEELARDLRRIERRVKVWWQESPQEAIAGVSVLVDHYYRTYRDFVAKDAQSLDAMVRSLTRIGFDAQDVHVVLRLPEGAGMALPGWAEGRLGPFAASARRRINPQVRGKAASYAKWLGLLVVSGSGDGIGQILVRELVFMRAAMASHASSGPRPAASGAA